MKRQLDHRHFIMPSWLRVFLAVAAAFALWFTAATIGNLAIRWLLPGYAGVEKLMDFSFGLLVPRLLVGAAASLAAGAACVAIGRGARSAVYLFAVLLLALFVPVHVNLWPEFPVWYHIVFLGSLIPLVVFGARLRGSRGASAA